MTDYRVGVSHDCYRLDGTPIIPQSLYDRLETAGCIPVPLPKRTEYRPGDLDRLSALIVRQTRVSSEVMEATPTLRHVARFGAGFDRVDIACADRLRITVSTTPNAVTLPVAMGNIALTLALATQIRPLDRLIRAGRWSQRSAIQGIAPYGRTLGIVGLGRIGKETARLALGLGMDVIACTGSGRGGMEGVTMLPFDAVVAKSDFLCLACPLMPETARMMGPSQFAAMKPGAYFISTSRGGLVDEPALLEALTGGNLAGAALDVFAEEPAGAENPLMQLENVILTPHAICNTDDMYNSCWNGAVDAVLAVREGRQPESVVTAFDGPPRQ
ncbi:2-hydroxyacid dehydrogenase [Pseudoruegeria sp. HB172150]|uniref:2-hydroxyacid dehydrogenase n=1 Tax=Pseudoruegeria sp. HB172150 TaxID=2721164 RepID=UPI001556DAAD|nr:NAD(P)-dependent oxidoreductase [Pseudoruegeria sp. HB172150]